jgi:hypothetical protein
MRFVQLTKQQKQNLIKDTEIKLVKNINIRLKQILKDHNIKTLRKINNYQELYNILYPTPIKTTYEILMEENKITSYEYSLSSLRNYNGNLTDKKELTEFLEKINRSVRHKIYNVLVNYFEKENNKELKDYYYNLRNNLFKEQQEVNKTEALPDIDYQKKLDELPDTKYKLIFMLMLNYENLRLSDYYTIKLRNYNKTTDNYINKDYTEIVFNHIVKTEIKRGITIKLTKAESKLFKDILKDNTDDLLFSNIQLNGFKKGMNRIAKKHFDLKSVSLLRRLKYKELPEGSKEIVNKVMDIAKKQGHSITTANRFYM